jgi:RIO kinase 1
LIHDEFDQDKFEAYEAQFDPLYRDRQARRKRKPRVKHKPKKSNNQILSEIADTRGVEGEFTTTYTPARYEKVWLLASLNPFYMEEMISDVLALVKGGKEASVYRCQAHPNMPHDLLAAKVYRPRMFRNLRNDKMYREGREILTASGRAVKATDDRIIRAIGKKTTFGAQVQHTSWLMYEYTTLEQLFRAGAAVPEPVGVAENAILMGYWGNAQQAAPTLNEISLSRDEADHLFQEVVRNIRLMLDHSLIHGDLSAYNMLYWEGRIAMIDFPQVTNIRTNPYAYFILERDLTRTCEYFSKQGVVCDPQTLLHDLWQHYVNVNAAEQAADESRRLEQIEQ